MLPRSPRAHLRDRRLGKPYVHTRYSVTYTALETISIIVIDAKASAAVKLSHRIQVGIYALYLEEIIETEKLDHVSVAAVGAVWLRYAAIRS